MAQHASLTSQRWSSFSLDQQLLMIANEMNRGAGLMAPADRERLLGCYERALRLTDLTVEVNSRRPLRRELLRWRDLLAALYLLPQADARAHAEAFRALLHFTPAAFQQLSLVDSPRTS